MVTVNCKGCGKVMEGVHGGTKYCPEGARIRRQERNRKKCRQYRITKQAKKAIAKYHAPKDPIVEIELERDAYNRTCKSGEEIHSYGHYVAQFDGPKESAAPSAGTPESGK